MRGFLPSHRHGLHTKFLTVPALKLLFLVLNLAEREWRMPPREWVMARAQFAILFEDRFQAA
jgi:transposase-like protein